jgi:hypothetical protein
MWWDMRWVKKAQGTGRSQKLKSKRFPRQDWCLALHITYTARNLPDWVTGMLLLSAVEPTPRSVLLHH